jgi:predicted amidophosphoribosyltransferase
MRGWHLPGRRWLAEATDALVSVFFLSGCRICDRLLRNASRVPLCGECLLSFERVPNIGCTICGRLLPGLARKEGEPLLCPAGHDKTYAFDKARSFALYKEAVVRAILLLKFEQIEPLGVWFAERLAHASGGRGGAGASAPQTRKRTGVSPSGANLQASGKDCDCRTERYG